MTLPINPYSSIPEAQQVRINADISHEDKIHVANMSPVRGMIQIVTCVLFHSFCRNLRANNVSTFLSIDRFNALLEFYRGLKLKITTGPDGKPVVELNRDALARDVAGTTPGTHQPAPGTPGLSASNDCGAEQGGGSRRGKGTPRSKSKKTVSTESTAS